jgi:hypothetical protein
MTVAESTTPTMQRRRARRGLRAAAGVLVDPDPGVVVVAALPWLVTFVLLPLLAVLAVGSLARRWLQRTGWTQHLLLRTVAPWLARTGLARVFVLAVASLVADLFRLG